MIPFGPWHPDAAGLNASTCIRANNCLPAANGFRPLPSLQSATGAVGTDWLTDAAGNYITTATGSYISVSGGVSTSTVHGLAVVFDDDGDVHTFCGDTADLYKLDATLDWLPVSRTSGGDYGAAATDRWQFGFSGGLVLAVNIADAPQKYLLNTSTNFEALGGTPPKARYIAGIGEFIVLGGLTGDERTIHWSGLGNPEHWTPGTQSCDTQTFQNGGPVRGIVGGEVGYVFQAETVRRMTFVPGGDLIFQFDEVEGGRGLAAPYSLVRLGSEAYYLAPDGFYRFSLPGGASQPIGVNKWVQTFIADIKPGSEQTVLGGIDPVGKYVVWAYNSASAVSAELNKCLIYDWARDEATTAELNVTALSQILTTGVTLDSLDAFGNLDTLPFSLDSAVWAGGASLLGLFSDTPHLGFFVGLPMEATFETTDGGAPQRTMIKGLRPHIDTRSVTAEVAAREAEGDTVVYGPAEAMESTGVISAWASGFVARARMTVAAGATWTKATGVDTVAGKIGTR